MTEGYLLKSCWVPKCSYLPRVAEVFCSVCFRISVRQLFSYLRSVRIESRNLISISGNNSIERMSDNDEFEVRFDAFLGFFVAESREKSKSDGAEKAFVLNGVFGHLVGRSTVQGAHEDRLPCRRSDFRNWTVDDLTGQYETHNDWSTGKLTTQLSHISLFTFINHQKSTFEDL